MDRSPPPPHVAALLPVALLVAMALSGCTVQQAGDARLDFEGGGDGAHQDVAVCEAPAALDGAIGVTGGEARVRILDGDDAVVFDEQVRGGLEFEDEPLEGASGQWALNVTRSGGFDGFYHLTLDC